MCKTNHHKGQSRKNEHLLSTSDPGRSESHAKISWPV